MTLRRLIIAAVAALCLTLALPGLTAAPEARCETVTPSDTPRRTISGGWGGADGETLLLVDPSQHSVAEFAGDGQRVAAPRSLIAESLSRLSPVEAWPMRNGGLVVEGAGTFLATVSPGLGRLSPPYDLAAESGIHAVYPYRWGLTDDSLDRGAVVMCGEVQRLEGGPWEVGLLYIPLTGQDRAPIQIAQFERVDLRRIGCRLGGQVIASVNGTAYVVLLDEQPQIYRVEPGAEQPLVPIPLNPRPEAMRVRPDLPHIMSRKDYPTLKEAVRRASMPVEMVGWQNHLYLLLREATALGGTHWSVAKIDPEADASENNVVTAKLDSDAPHISMIPGPQRWAFVSKAEPKSIQDQEVLDFKMVPAVLLRGLGGTPTLCR